MISTSRVAVLCIMAAVATSCAGGTTLATGAKPALRAFETAFGKRWTVSVTEDGFASSITGVPNTQITADGRELVPYASELAMVDSASFPATPDEEIILGPIHSHVYRQRIQNRQIQNAAIIVKRSDEGGPYDVILNVTRPASDIPPDRVGAAGAKERALSQFQIFLNLYARDLALQERSSLTDLFTPVQFVRCHSEATVCFDVTDPPPPELQTFEREIHLVYVLSAYLAHRTPCGREVPLAQQYTIDASTLKILRTSTLASNFVEGRGRVFEPNPVATPGVRPPFDSLVNSEARPYFTRDLHGLAEPDANNRYALRGKYVEIGEMRCPPSIPDSVPGNSGVPDFFTARGDKQFAATSAYYHVDELARWTALLGFGDSVPDALVIDVDGGKGSSIQAQYVPETTATRRHIWFGRNEDSVIFEAEDGELVAHEYGHAILQQRTGDRFRLDGTKRGTNESRPVNEAFADYWALSAFASENEVQGKPLDCLADWAFIRRGSCLRRYPATPYEDFDHLPVDHAKGEIWSGALYRIFLALDKDRRAADGIILGGHFQRFDKGDAPTMREMAEGIVIADAQKFGGIHKDALCKVFKKKGIGPVTCCAKKSACTASWTARSRP